MCARTRAYVHLCACVRPSVCVRARTQADDEDGWDDETTVAEVKPAPKVILVARVIKDYFPETSTGRQLTLLLGTHARARTHARTHARAHTRTRTHAHARLHARGHARTVRDAHGADELVYVFAKESPEGPGWWEVRARASWACAYGHARVHACADRRGARRDRQRGAQGETRGESGCFQPEYIEEVKP